MGNRKWVGMFSDLHAYQPWRVKAAALRTAPVSGPHILCQALGLVLLLLGGPMTAPAMSPLLASTTPLGGQRGTELELTLRGERLADAQQIIWYSPGIQVLGIQIPTNQAQTVKARIQISPDCRLGEHALRIRCASGVSDLRTFWVGPFPTVNDTAPNSDFAQPQTIPLNVTVEGVVENEAVHYYRVEARQGQRLSVEVEGMRLGRTFFDPFVAIMDPKRFVLASSDDTALLMQDPACSIIAPAEGPYLIQLRESSYGGNGDCHYRLHVGSFPRPTGVFPAGGKAGESISLKFLGLGAADLTTQMKLPSEPSGALAVFAESGGQTAPSPNWLRVSPFPNVLEIEPNDDRDHATSAGTNLPIALNGIIDHDGDVDWYNFTATKGQTIEVNVYARRLRSPLDSVLSIHDPNGNSLASNDDSAGADSYLRFTPPNDGRFFLRVSDHLKKGGPDFFYRVELTPVAGSLSLKLPDVSRNNAQERKCIVVPRGNRFATLVQAERQNFSGDLSLQAVDLPSGIVAQGDPMPGNQTLLPMVFEAAADAPIAGKLCDLRCKPVDTTQHLIGNLHQDFVFVRGEPGDSIYSQTFVDQIAAAVVEEVPFKINVVEPKVPLVRNGTMDLKVVALRRPGFDEPITLRMIYNPPGIGSANEVMIPKGETNALYRINANGEAEVRAWKIAVLATAPVNGAAAWVSSQLTSLTVAEPFLAMKIEMASTEPGQAARVLCTLDQKAPFEGKATCKLLGLPNGATTADATITKDDKQLVFDVATTAATPVGQHRSLFCAVTIVQTGEPIIHSLGGGGCLRIDAPKPAPVEVAAAKPAPPAAKPLTHLEKLRLEHAGKQNPDATGTPK